MIPCFSDTPAFTLIVFVLQITYRMKYLVFLLLSIAPRIHPLIGSLVWHSHWLWSCYKPISLIRSAFCPFLNILTDSKISQCIKHVEQFARHVFHWENLNKNVCMKHKIITLLQKNLVYVGLVAHGVLLLCLFTKFWNSIFCSKTHNFD